jgi:hypothetical protein
VVGARQAYLETLAALRARALPATDVATRVRLSKSAEAYLASRSRQREAQYEALLAAGRTTWRQGERVRHYKAMGGGYVWLPDETDEPLAEVDGEGDEGTLDATPVSAPDPEDRCDYDVEHYANVLLTSYAGRLKKAFTPEDFAQLFRVDGQAGLFDRPVDGIQPLWIRP